MQDIAPTSTFADAGAAQAFDPRRSYRLSRFAHLRPVEGGGLIAESPLSGSLLPLTNSTQIALVMGFLTASQPQEMVEGLDEDRRAALLGFFTECHRCGLLTAVDDQDRGEDEHDGLAHWEPHDLMFHARSRRGRTPFTVGATYALSHTLPAEPALSEPTRPLALELPKGDTDRRDGRSLTEVLESRRSRYSTEPVSLDALGEFLYRTSRITGQRQTPDGETLLQRVYPSGGSLHALDLYVIPTRCPDLPLGVYQYRPGSHGLAFVSGPGPDVNALLEEARRGTGRLNDVPSILFVFSARFRRVARKYSGLSYRLILKDGIVPMCPRNRRFGSIHCRGGNPLFS